MRARTPKHPSKSPRAFHADELKATISAPAIEWKQAYGSQVLESSNLIQTSDGGYAFMDVGYTYQFSLKPSTVFKADSKGNMDWNKTLALFTGSRIIQTNDNGYEISGWWHPNGTYSNAPVLIKMDSKGSIQWNQNYTTLPDLGVNSSRYMFPYASGYQMGGSISSNDGGFVYWTDGNITKNDSNNKTQWVKTLVYPTLDAYPTYTYPLMITFVIETSDGELVSLGVGYNLLDNDHTGKIYLIKTASFLPMPSQTQLPTPLSTLSLTPSQGSDNNFALIVPILIVVLVLVIFSLFYRRIRKTLNLKK